MPAFCIKTVNIFYSVSFLHHAFLNGKRDASHYKRTSRKCHSDMLYPDFENGLFPCEFSNNHLWNLAGTHHKKLCQTSWWVVANCLSRETSEAIDVTNCEEKGKVKNIDFVDWDKVHIFASKLSTHFFMLFLLLMLTVMLIWFGCLCQKPDF